MHDPMYEYIQGYTDASRLAYKEAMDLKEFYVDKSQEYINGFLANFHDRVRDLRDLADEYKTR